MGKASIALCVVGMALALVGFLGTFFNIPYMAMWGAIQTYTTGPTGVVTYQINSFGSLNLFSSMMGTYNTQSLAPITLLGMLPGIFIPLGIGFVVGGTKIKACGIIGGILLILGPALFVVFQGLYMLGWYPPDGYPYDVFNFYDSGSLFSQHNLGILFGSYNETGMTITWFLGTGVFLPFLGGILGIIGGGLAGRD